MSYILEALKKSEQERARDQGALPDIKSVHTPSSTLHQENRRWWPLVLVIVLVIAGAGLTALYVVKFQTADTAVKQEQTVSAPVVENQETKKAVKKENKNSVVQSPQTQPSHTKSVQKSPVKENTRPAKEQKQPQVVFSKQQLHRDDVIGNVEEQQDQEAEQTLQQSTPVEIKQNADPTAVAISDIPDSVRRKIPGISFEGHVYSSNPERRSVMINGHKRREGDTIGGDLLLKEITASGAEFEIEGYRFRLNALQDWSLN